MLPLRLLLALLLAVPFQAPETKPRDADLLAGITLVREGDFEAAVLRLDAAVRRLEAGGPRPDLARAYLYLGIAYLELEQESVARGKFIEAAGHDPKLTLDPREFSAQVIRSFEAARQVAAQNRPPAASVPRTASPASPEQKRRSAAPLLIVGGAAAAAGVALAAGGGGGSPLATTTTVSGTTTTTTRPAGTTTTTTTTTTPVGCSYRMSPEQQGFSASGGIGTCEVKTASRSNWTVESTEPWLVIVGNESGSGDGTVRFRVMPNDDEDDRKARLRLRRDHSVRCEIEQSGLKDLRAAERVVRWTSELAVPGASGQALLNGAELAFHGPGRSQATGAMRPGPNRIEAVLLEGSGQPGLWRFDLSGAARPGSLRVLMGEAAALSPDGITFRLAGRSGESVAFLFEPFRD
jgi:hypothetical protein